MKKISKCGKVCLLLIAGFMAAHDMALAQNSPDAPPPAVGVIELESKDIPVMSELPGRIAATRVSEVRARVTGIVQERVFEQGSFVTKGEVLYRIDPAIFRVRVASAEASLQKAKAVLENARKNFEREKTLRDKNAASGFDYDTATVNLAQADADVALAKAALDEAKINLEYTEVRAPISGVIGGALVTEGALVTADGSLNLALIQQVDPVYADFTQSVQELLAIKHAVDEGSLADASSGKPSVEIIFTDGRIYPEPGRLLYTTERVDPSTGQVTLRAEFPNPKRHLLPGMYIRLRIEQGRRPSAIAVPQRAVIRTETGQAQVYVVGKDDTAQIRDITLGQTVGSEWVVEAGLKSGERVIVDGIQKVLPGAKITPEPWLPVGNKTPDQSNHAKATAGL